MNISTSIHLASEVPDEILSKLERDYDYMSTMLEVASFTSDNISWEDYISEIDDFPPMKELPKELKASDEVAKRYRRAIKNNMVETLYDIFITRLLIGEQLEYIYKLRDNEEGCSAYFIAAYLDAAFYGSSFAFWSEDAIFVQATTRCLDHTLLSMFSLDDDLVRLNTVLEAPIESLARSLDVKKIYISSLDSSLKGYGYKKSNDVHFPCKMITGDSKVYAKTL